MEDEEKGDYFSEVFSQQVRTKMAIDKLLQSLSSQQSSKPQVQGSLVTALFHCLELAQGLISGDIYPHIPEDANLDDLHFQLAQLQRELTGFPDLNLHPVFQQLHSLGENVPPESSQLDKEDEQTNQLQSTELEMQMENTETLSLELKQELKQELGDDEASAEVLMDAEPKFIFGNGGKVFF